MSDEVLERIKKAARMVYERGRPVDETGLYAEEDENGVVWIFREDESIVAYMPRAAFDQLGFALRPRS